MVLRASPMTRGGAPSALALLAGFLCSCERPQPRSTSEVSRTTLRADRAVSETPPPLEIRGPNPIVGNQRRPALGDGVVPQLGAEQYEPSFVRQAAAPVCSDGPDCRRRGLEEWTHLDEAEPDTPVRERTYMFVRAACEQRDGWGCWEQATKLNSMFSVPAANAEAKETSVNLLYERSCKLGYGRGCYSVGTRLYQPGDRMVVDWEAARPWLDESTRLYTQACEAGEQLDCTLLAYNYNSGRGVARNPARAAELYRGSCERDDGYSCDQLAKILAADDLGEPDIDGAHAAFERGCELSVYYGCAALGTAYLKGNHVESSDAQAIKWFRKGCPPNAVERDGACCMRLRMMCDEGKAAACD